MPENPENVNYTSGSIVKSLGLPTPHDLTLSSEERVLAVMARKIDELSKEVYDLKTKKVVEETQLPPEMLKQMGVLPKHPCTFKRGHGYRPIMAYEIIEAKKEIESKRGYHNEAMVARHFGVSFITYKKYAKMYNLWEPKTSVRGKRNLFDPEKGKYPLSEILSGKHPNYHVFKIKDKLIRSGVKELKCELCGYKERRVVDGKVPLILNFMDGNHKNHSLENMKLYCYNCTFTSGRGYIRSGNYHFDPDWLQDAHVNNVDEPARW